MLGKEGNQPFEIKASGVSRVHAKIEIDDNGNWWLEDCDSSNGTFVRDHDGKLRRWGRERITPETFICLGPDNSKGCSFYAHQVKDYGNYMPDYIFMQEKEELYDRKDKELENKIKRFKIAGPIVVLAFVFCITGIPFINDALGENAMVIRITLSSLSGLITTLYDGSARKDKLKKERRRWQHCPNPACSHKLKADEIANLRCSKCKKP